MRISQLTSWWRSQPTAKCLVFTQNGSAIYTVASTLDRANIFCLSPSIFYAVSSSRNEMLLPLYDTTQLLNTLDMSISNAHEARVVFDNITDLIISLGVDKTYRFLRHVTEIVSSDRAIALFLLNSEAHDKTVRGAFEGLFSTIMMKRNAVELIK